MIMNTYHRPDLKILDRHFSCTTLTHTFVSNKRRRIKREDMSENTASTNSKPHSTSTLFSSSVGTHRPKTSYIVHAHSDNIYPPPLPPPPAPASPTLPPPSLARPNRKPKQNPKKINQKKAGCAQPRDAHRGHRGRPSHLARGISDEPGQVPGVHRADSRRREGSVPRVEDEGEHPQVRFNLPL